jgi:hypothetical protein
VAIRCRCGARTRYRRAAWRSLPIQWPPPSALDCGPLLQLGIWQSPPPLRVGVAHFRSPEANGHLGVAPCMVAMLRPGPGRDRVTPRCQGLLQLIATHWFTHRVRTPRANPPRRRWGWEESPKASTGKLALLVPQSPLTLRRRFGSVIVREHPDAVMTCRHPASVRSFDAPDRPNEAGRWGDTTGSRRPSRCGGFTTVRRCEVRGITRCNDQRGRVP